MPDNNPNKGQVNQYDKILRENLEVTLPVIIREVLGIEVAESEELPDDIQHTKERKPDALKKITTVSGETFLLQIEFQVKSEEDLVYRMAEYAVMLMRRYRLAVRQYVIFLRKKRPSMATFINSEQLKFSYNLLLISEMNYRLFLNSENPEVKMLAILADFANIDSYLVVKEVVEEIREHTKGDFAQSRYFKQLRIFVQLRSSIQPQFVMVMQTVSQFFKEENDFLFKKGVEKERAIADAKMREERAKADAKMREEKRNIARAMKADGLPAFQISKFTGLTPGEIEKL